MQIEAGQVATKAFVIRSEGWQPLEPDANVPSRGMIGHAFKVGTPEGPVVVAEWLEREELTPVDLWSRSITVVHELTFHSDDPIMRKLRDYAARRPA